MSWWRRIGYSLSEYFEPSLLVGLWHWQARIHRHIKHVAEATIEGTFLNKIDQIRFSFLRSVLIHVPEVGWPQNYFKTRCTSDLDLCVPMHNFISGNVYRFKLRY